MRRIFAGLFKYSLKSYIVNLKGNHRGDRSVEEPTYTQTSSSNQQMLVEPFLTQFFGEKNGQEPRTRRINEPCWTITAQGRMGIVEGESFVINLSHTKNNDSQMCKHPDEPLNTICGKGMISLVEPFLTKFYGGLFADSVHEPIGAITANFEHYGITEPYLVSYHAGLQNGGVNRSYSTDEPIPTLDTSNRFAVAEPYLIKYYGNEKEIHSVNEPLPTITTKDKFGVAEVNVFEQRGQRGFIPDDGEIGLCIPILGIIVFIRFRMLQPHELAAAMSFPTDYYFFGTRNEKVKQIGNAVPKELAKALAKSSLEIYR